MMYTTPIEWLTQIDAIYNGWASFSILLALWVIILVEFAFRDQFVRGWIVASFVNLLFALLLLPVGFQTFNSVMLYTVLLTVGLGFRYWTNR